MKGEKLLARLRKICIEEAGGMLDWRYQHWETGKLHTLKTVKIVTPRARFSPLSQWGACETMQALSQPQPAFLTQKLSSQPQPALLTQKLSFFSSVTSPNSSRKESNTDSSTEGSLEKKGDETIDPVSQKQSDSVKNKEATKSEQPDPKKTVKINESDSESDLESDSNEEKELSTEDLIRLVEEKEELLKVKHREIQSMQEKVLRSYAEVENVMDRTRRDAENSKKFAIQSFAKSLLDVADNLGRASSVAKESFSKLDASKDSNGAAALLKTLLEGVEMTEKQLSDVFKKYGVEKFDPINEQFDPHRHMAVFQFSDASKEVGSVGVVLKPGYMLHDRVIRPAEVGVVEAVHTEAAEVSETAEDEAAGSSKVST